MAAICSGRPGWLGKLGIALLAAWFLVLIISMIHIFKSNSLSSRDADTANKENTQRLTQMVNDFEILKKQNDALKNFILGYVCVQHIAYMKKAMLKIQHLRHRVLRSFYCIG